MEYGPIDKTAILSKRVDSLFDSDASTVDEGKDVHTEHCCKRHGCKYGPAALTPCTVESGEKAQSYSCEQCEDDPDPVVIADDEKASVLAAFSRHRQDHRAEAIFAIGWLTNILLDGDGQPATHLGDGETRRRLARAAGVLLALTEHEAST